MIATNGYLPIILHYCFPVNNKKRIDLSPIPRYNEKCRGDVPKWLKGPHSKCGRSGNRREGSNPSISAFLPIYDRKNFIYILLYKKHSHLLTIVYFICIIATVMKTQFNIGDWSNGMIGVSKTFGGSSILSSPVLQKVGKLSNQSFPAFCFIYS